MRSLVRRLRRPAGVGIASFLIGAQLALVSPFGVSLVAAGGGCTTVVPELGDVAVNQGLDYPILNRGKQTLVRLYLRLPTTCSTKATVTVSGATLAFQLLDHTGAVISGSPASLSAPVSAISGNLQAAIQTNATTDPIFVIPGPSLAPVSESGKFSLQITGASIRYTVSGVTGTSTSTPATVSTGPKFPYATVFEPKTNALRLLIVPLGDASSPNTQFSTAAKQAMQNALGDLARMAPVPDGTGSLTSSTGGVRYDFNPSLLDIGPKGLNLLNTSGLFCGSSANFSTLSASLSSLLTSYNAANPAAQADRAVGAVDPAISTGASGGCDEGRAAVPTSKVAATTAWVRAVPDVTGTPSPTASVLAMELLHTFGGCAYDAANPTRCPQYNYHSQTTSDFSASRGYNLTARSYLATPPTTMRLGSSYSSWNRTTTLYETPDYLLFSCVITPGFVLPTGYTSVPGCATGGGTGANPGSAGTGSGVPAGPTYFLDGITDGTGGTPSLTACPATRTASNPAGDAKYTAPGTTVFGSFTADLGGQSYPTTTPEPGSDYRIRYFNATTHAVVGDPNGIGVPLGTSNVDHGSTSTTPIIPTINVAIDYDTAADQIELVKNSNPANRADLSADAVLFCVNRTVAPALSATAVTHPSQIAFSKTDGSGISNIYLVGTDGTGLTQLTNNGAVGRSLHDPVWSPDGTRIAYLTSDASDAIHVINADGTGDHAVTGTITTAPVRWTPDGTDLIVSYLAGQFSLRLVNPDVGGLGAFLSTGGFELSEGVESPDGQTVFGLDPANGAVRAILVPPFFATPSGTDTIALGTGASASGTAWSPDGAHVAWAQTDGTTSQVHLAGTSFLTFGGIPAFGATSTVGAAGARDPAFSQDGQTVYYVADATHELRAVNVDGTNDRAILATSAGAGLSVSIAAPLPRIAMACTDYAICTEDSNGSGRQLVATGTGQYSDVTWSPDNSLLGFTVIEGATGFAGIYTMRPDGSGIKKIATAGGAQSIRFSPDGKWISYTRSNAGALETVIASLDGTFQTSFPGSAAAWAPDSKHVVYNNGSGLSFGTWDGTAFTQYGTGTGAAVAGIYCYGATTPAPTCDPAGGGASNADWSPDGTKIIAIRGGNGTNVTVASVSSFLPSGWSTVSIANVAPGLWSFARWESDSVHALVTGPRVAWGPVNLSDRTTWVINTTNRTGYWLPTVATPDDFSPAAQSSVAPANEVTVTSPVPNDVTVDVTYTCPGGQTFPIADGLSPATLSGGTASYFAGFDPSLVCGGGAGTLKAVASDGFSLSNTVTVGTYQPTVKPPNPNISGPLPAATYGPTSDIVLSGTGSSAQGGTVSSSWTLALGSGSPVQVGTGQVVDLGGPSIPTGFRQPNGSWLPGDYVATLTVTDSRNISATAPVRFSVTAPPVVAVTGVVDGGTYVTGSSLAPGCSTTDAGGGIGSQATATVSNGSADAAGTHTVTCDGATDSAGHPSSPATATYLVVAAPLVTVTGVAQGGVYTLGAVPAAGCAVTPPSGMTIGTPPTVTVTGGTDNGVGLLTATCGGGAIVPPTGGPVPLPTVSVTYTVKYAANTGVLQPMNPDNSSVFNRSRTVPVKFGITGSPATGFDTTAWTIKLQQVSCASFDTPLASVEDVPSNTPTTVFRWDPTALQYIYNATISNLPSATCWTFKIALDDTVTTITSPVFKTK